MWSGPRNISTAMMRAWGNRPDTAVIDEPFYACYLRATGAKHPGASEIIAAGETNWAQVVDRLIGPTPEGKHIFYQKQMTHHLLPEINRGWLDQVINCFLIRDPREVICSYLRKNHDPTAEDLGFPQQAEIFEWVRRRTGSIPPVIDAKDVLENPRRLLGLLCDSLGVEFREEMLSWAPGPRKTDGIWAKHWYTEVAESTSFQPYQAKNESVPESLREIHARCREYYERLHQHRLH